MDGSFCRDLRRGSQAPARHQLPRMYASPHWQVASWHWLDSNPAQPIRSSIRYPLDHQGGTAGSCWSILLSFSPEDWYPSLRVTVATSNCGIFERHCVCCAGAPTAARHSMIQASGRQSGTQRAAWLVACHVTRRRAPVEAAPERVGQISVVSAFLPAASWTWKNVKFITNIDRRSWTVHNDIYDFNGKQYEF